MTGGVKVQTAADLMNADVVVIGPNDSLQEAMQVMTENHVSGLPVVDQRNHCVGVITASDIVAFVESDQEELESDGPRSENWFNPETQKWEQWTFSHEMLGEYDEVPVSEAMTIDPLTVGPDATVRDVARLMTTSEIHRVFVVDSDGRLVGVISSFDFVRLLAEE